MGQADGFVCDGRCPVCGRVVRLTWQTGGDVDRCPCGIEAVLVVVSKNVLQWYWRDPMDLPSFDSAGLRPGSAQDALKPARPARKLPEPVQLRLVPD